jgi:guanylate kinase
MLLNKKHRRIVLVGKAASGKDHFRKKIESRGFKYAVSYTTRPQREGEVHGKDYYFISEDEAKVLIESGFFYEYVIFNGWIYGTSVTQFFSDDLFIMTPKGIHEIKPEDRLESFVIYLDIPSNVRIKRLNKRHMPGDSVKRRIEADELDFSDFTDYDLKITNSDF